MAGKQGAASGGPAELSYASGRGRWVLVATILGSSLAAIDATVVGIALPAIGRDFHASLATLQWVFTAYTLTLAGLLLFAGALGDRYGRKKIFMIGVAWFAAASALCAAAPNAPTLILARAVQGIGAALLAPGSLAILEASFRQEDRSKAIGAWSGFAGVGTAIGPFLGGWLIAAVSWRLIFIINLPLAALVLVVAAEHVPESRDPDATGKLDIAGGGLVTIGLVGLTYGLIEGPSSGWGRPVTLVALIGGVVLLAGFLLRERLASEPLLPLGMFASAQFSAANVVTFVVYGALGGALFLLPIELEQVSHYTALEAGISLLPVTLIMLLLSARSGALAARIGPRLQMSVGPVVIGAGLLLFARIGYSGNYLTEVLPAVVIFAFGLAINVAPLTSTVSGRRSARARRDGLRGQQRCLPGRRTDRGGGSASRGRPVRRFLPPAGAVLGGLPQGLVHHGGPVRPGRHPGRRHHPQPQRDQAAGGRGRRAGAALRAGRPTAGSRWATRSGRRRPVIRACARAGSRRP
jgi:EmrB/QacA subfamily drug resistance transporter